MSDTTYETVEAIAQRLVTHYVPRVRGARTPMYTKPSLTVKPLPSCTPRFAELMRGLCDQLDLTDRAVCPEDVAHLLRYHRMYGLKRLYKVGLTGFESMRTTAQHNDCYLQLGYELTVLVGELLLRLLGAVACETWFPWHNFTLITEGDRGFMVGCASLEPHVSGDGRPFYSSCTAHTIMLRGRRLRVAFTPHALTRLSERASVSRSYGSLGDVFGLVEMTQYYEPLLLPTRQEAFAVFENCMPGFFSYRYAEEILGTLDPAQTYVYRVGYCPVVADGGFWVAKTALPPGYTGTPEYQALRTTSFDPGVQERLLERCAQQSYAMLCTTRDFGLLRWFHRHGVPQVKRLVGQRLEGV